MTHRFMQQHAGPAGPEHYGHLARRCRSAVKVDERGLYRFIDITANQYVIKAVQAKPATTTGRTHFSAALVLGNHGHGEPHQRTHVCCQGAVSAGHQHHVVLARQARHDLHDPWVLGLGQALHFFQQRHLGGTIQRGDGVVGRVEGARLGHLAGTGLHLAALTLRTDGTNAVRGVLQRRP